jgi:hypothetical protein
MIPNNTAMAIRVLPALSASGFSNAETPLLMASVPVMAAHPEAKARKMRNTVKGAVPAASAGSVGWAIGLRLPVNNRTKPTAMRVKNSPMKA